jgi:hypothetical protein
LLVGGRGAVTLYGDADEDILISGTTDLAAIDPAYGYVILEWARQDGTRYTERVNHLRNGGGFSGDVRLNGATVLDDDAVDTMWGGGGRDWFFARQSDLLRDLANDESLDYLFPPLELPGVDDPFGENPPPV